MLIWRVWSLCVVGVFGVLMAAAAIVDAQVMPGAPMPGAPTPGLTPTPTPLSPGAPAPLEPTPPTPTPTPPTPAAPTPILPTSVPTPLPVWLPGPTAVGADCSCDGFIDAPTSSTFPTVDKPLLVSGWASDRTAQGWSGFDAVHIYSGKAGEGGTFLAAGTLGQTRPDVAAVLGNPNALASGFNVTVPAGRLAAGRVTLSVYVHSPSRGWWYKQVAVTMVTPRLAQPVLQVTFPAQGEKLKTTTIYTFEGYAFDPGAFDGTGVDLVEVYLDGARGEPQSQSLGRALVGDPSDAASAQYGVRFADTGWSLRFDPSKYKVGNRTLYVYARSNVTGREALSTVDLNIVTP